MKSKFKKNSKWKCFFLKYCKIVGFPRECNALTNKQIPTQFKNCIAAIYNICKINYNGTCHYCFFPAHFNHFYCHTRF